ncbi:hypothetical protein [Candidatus Regiella endosymbiont of Tuberolachnus salignus]|uniref:hypothetical protein n=1 Tax=Candidatus Regiella endosymbiont of Tuberolachnus salignus TaxID=3077956 RepID=UPI0030CCDD9C
MKKVEVYSVRKPNYVLINRLELTGNTGSLIKQFETGKNSSVELKNLATEEKVALKKPEPKPRTLFFPVKKGEEGIAANSKPITKEEAANRILGAVRARTKLLASKEFNDASRQELTYKSANSKIYGKKFYRGIEGITLSVPDRKPSTPLEGGAKKAIGISDRWIALAPLNEQSPKFDTKSDNSDLLGLRTMIYSTVVGEDVMIALNAGESLAAILFNNNTVEIKDFENSTKDLAELHKIATYLIDIKLENMAKNIKLENMVDDKNNSVKFIDLESRVRQGLPTTPGITFENTTIGLLQQFTEISPKIIEGKEFSPQEKNSLKTYDEYALLMTIVAATTKDDKLRQSMIDPCVDTKEFCDPPQYFDYPGAMNELNEGLMKQWINENVKTEYHDYAENLLKNPAQFAKNRTENGFENTSLSEILIFQPSS